MPNPEPDPQPLQYDPPDPARLALQSKQMDLEAGWLGRAFGSRNSAPIYIACVAVLVMLVTGVGLLFVKDPPVSVLEYWKVVAIPVTSLALGYLFGRGSSN